MAYRIDVPVDTHNVRGVLGDLVAVQANFADLADVSLSGINGLISGGANVAGAVPVAQSSSANALWFARKLDIASGDIVGISGVNHITGTGATNGQAFVYNSGTDTWEPGSVAAAGGSGGGVGVERMAMLYLASGQTRAIPASTHTVVTGLTAGRNVGGFIVNTASGFIHVPSGVTHVKLTASIRYEFVVLASGHRHMEIQISGGKPLLFATEPDQDWVTDDVLTMTASTGLIPVANHGVSGAATATSGVDTNVVVGSPIGIVAHQTTANPLNVEYGEDNGGAKYATWLQMEAFKLVSSESAAGVSGGGASPAGEYICHLTTTTGQALLVPNSGALTIVTICNVERRNVGGFVTGSGTITVPTGSGYTHAIVRCSARISGVSPSANGYRQIAIRTTSGIQDPGQNGTVNFFPNGNPWCQTNVFAPAVTSSLIDTQMIYSSPLLPISGNETFQLIVAQNDTSGSLGLVIQSGQMNWMEVQCYKLASGGIG